MKKYNQVWTTLYAVVTMALLLTLTGCATTQTPPPENVENVCSIFNEKEDWYKDVMDAERKWGTPAHVLMAIVRYESRFVDNARPPHKKFFGIIPMGRPSTAYGYCQAVNGTWKNYLQETGNTSAERANFRDAMDFIGWYTNVSHDELGISKWDGYNQYLAYHEGQVGYSRNSHNKKRWLLRVAQKVHDTSEVYALQLRDCRDTLELKHKKKFAAQSETSGLFSQKDSASAIISLD